MLAPGSESRMRDRELAPLRSPVLGWNNSLMLPGFQLWSGVERLMNTTIKKPYLLDWKEIIIIDITEKRVCSHKLSSIELIV